MSDSEGAELERSVRRQEGVRLLSACLATLIATQSPASPPIANYFPVEAGFVLVTEEGYAGKAVTVTSTVQTPTRQGETLISPRLVERGGVMRGRYFALTDRAFSLVGVQQPGEPSPLVFPEPIQLLVAPVAVGTAWSMPYPLEDLGNRVARLELRITAIDATVTTRAGTFKNCVRLEGKAILSAEGATGELDDVTFVCPGVGVAKANTREVVRRDGKMVTESNEPLELISFSRPPAPATGSTPR